jgi:hypothetical protein
VAVANKHTITQHCSNISATRHVLHHLASLLQRQV